MVTTIYKCDKCGNEQTTSGDFWAVGVVARNQSFIPGQGASVEYAKDKYMQVCRPCLESFGIHAMKRHDKPEPPAPPTLEDLIRDIVAQGIEAAR